MDNTLIIIDRGELKEEMLKSIYDKMNQLYKEEMLKSIYDKMNQLYKADGFYKKGEIK